MLLEELTVHNVGLFRHSHTLQLAAPSPNKPVVLIGGLNGSGKTTLLDSIQLALYGKRARLSNRGSLPYDEFLRRSINRNIGEGEISFVQVSFRRWSQGREQIFQIRREWSAGSNGTSERLEVRHNDKIDRVLTDSWAEFIEDVIPADISHLFFFDGEKIEGFADLESSTQLLSKAVHSLLGLDIVNRLNTDLIALERRKQVTLKSDVERQQIEAAKAEIAKLDEQREDVLSERAARQNELGRREKALREIEVAYEKSGGPLFEQRDELESMQRVISGRIYELEKELRHYAEGDAPLLLLRELLTGVQRQALREEAAAESQVVAQVLSERDEQLLALIKKHKIAGATLADIETFLSEDRAQRHREGASTQAYLHLTPESKDDLIVLLGGNLAQAQNRIVTLLQEADELQTKHIDLERKLASMPTEDVAAELLSRRQEATSAVQMAQQRLAEADAELNRLDDLREHKQAKLVTQIEKTVEGQFRSEDAQRILSHSRRVRHTIEKFRTAVVERHVNRIAELVLDSFRRLLRKETLIASLSIDPKTFALELRSAGGMVLSPDRLSAGERQLLAVSLLWGLARASGRPLPVVIDTPLGRLDASHRSKLVENYFPHASHQVLLLSTDKEIESHYYEQLKPYIGHNYYLEYNDSLGSTQVKQGYFW